MEHNIHELLADYAYDLRVHDIDSREDWLHRYNNLVPVLNIESAQQEQEICHYFFDLNATKKALTSS